MFTISLNIFLIMNYHNILILSGILLLSASFLGLIIKKLIPNDNDRKSIIYSIDGKAEYIV